MDVSKDTQEGPSASSIAPDRDRRFALMAMVYRHPDDGAEGTGYIPSELLVRGHTPVKEEGNSNEKRFKILKTSPRAVWTVDGLIELLPEATEIDCEVRGEAGEIGTSRLSLEGVVPDESVKTVIELGDSPSQFGILWKMVDTGTAGKESSVNAELLNRSVEMYRRFKSTGHLADISEAIATLRPAMETTASAGKGMVTVMGRLGAFLLCRFDHTGDLQDVDEAVRLQRQAVEMTPDGDANLLTHLTNLGSSLQARFERTGDLKDLTESIQLQKQAVELAAGEQADLAGLLTNLGNSLDSLYQTTGNLEDLDQIVAVRRQVLELSPEGHAFQHTFLTNLGNALIYRYKRTGDLRDVAESIKVQAQAVELTPEGYPDLPGWISNVGNGYFYRFNRTGDLNDLAEAIKNQRRAVLITPEGHASLPAQLLNLGMSLLAQFNRTGQLPDLTEAIGMQTRALGLVPKGHGALPALLTNYGNALLTRFEVTGSLQDLTNAIKAQKGAVDSAPRGHADLPTFLTNLGDSYLFRCKRTGDLQDIAEAIEVQTRAVALAPEGHANLSRWLTGLGSSYLFRFNRTGNLQDLAEAIRVQSRAVELAAEGTSDVATLLNNLGGSLRSRFERTENLQDIDEAIAVQKRAVGLTPEGHVNLPRYLAGLGISYAKRFGGTGDLRDIAEAIEAQSRAVDLTPEGHESRAGRFANLGSSFFLRFGVTGNLQNIEKAINAQRQAVSLTPEEHADLPGWLTNLGNSLRSRFQRTRDLEDIAEAIRIQTQATDLAPDGHAVLPTLLNNLGHAWYDRFTLSELPDHLEEAINYHKTAATTSRFGRPLTRLEAAKRWARLLNQYQPEAEGALAAFQVAIELLPLVVGLEDTVQRRYTTIQDYKNLPLEASAVALRLGRPDLALEWLEQGRCLVWGQQSQLHTPLDALRTKDRALAQRFTDVSKQLESAGASRQHSGSSTSLSEKASLEDEAVAHVRLANMWEDLLTEVRNIPGFEAFLQPSRCSTILQNLPESGAVVAINVYESRCDAVALRAGSHKPVHIPLPDFTYENAKKHYAALSKQLGDNLLRDRSADWGGDEDPGSDPGRALKRARPGKRVTGTPVHLVLERLWNEVVEPILRALGYLQERDEGSTESLPRVWWCPTSILSFLPLHAAGVYTGPDPHNAMDYVVSSYTPTVAALTQRVISNRAVPFDTERAGLFLTCQPEGIKSSQIPGTTKEVHAIYECAKRHAVRSLNLEGDAVGPSGCLEYMEKFSSIHLACHASQNVSDPLQSRFFFHTGTLTLGAIMGKNLPDSDLAFLSACKTSTGEAKVPDEAVHLAAGMLGAGYRRVVATMWSISDRYAPDLAVDFYGYLWNAKKGKSNTQFDGSSSAYALHHAIQRLRAHGILRSSEDNSLLAWVPYVHFGY